MNSKKERDLALAKLFGDFDYPEKIYDTQVLPSGEVQHSIKNEVVNFAIEKVNQSRREKYIDQVVKNAQESSKKD